MWTVLTRAHAGNPLSITNGTTTLAVGQLVTCQTRYGALPGRINSIDDTRDGIWIEARMDDQRGTALVRPEEVTPAAPPKQSEPHRLASLAQSIAENHARYAREQARADLERLRKSGAGYQAILEAEALVEMTGYAE